MWPSSECAPSGSTTPADDSVLFAALTVRSQRGSLPKGRVKSELDLMLADALAAYTVERRAPYRAATRSAAKGAVPPMGVDARWLERSAPSDAAAHCRLQASIGTVWKSPERGTGLLTHLQWQFEGAVPQRVMEELHAASVGWRLSRRAG